jgi:hypothetical protein
MVMDTFIVGANIADWLGCLTMALLAAEDSSCPALVARFLLGSVLLDGAS